MKEPGKFQDLLLDETKAYAVLATISKNGAPQATPVWFNMDGETLQINTSLGRVKDRNMRMEPRVALTILDPKDPYRYLQIRGKVKEIIEAGAEEHIHALSLKYTGHRYSIPAGQKRVIFRIVPSSYFGKD